MDSDYDPHAVCLNGLCEAGKTTVGRYSSMFQLAMHTGASPALLGTISISVSLKQTYNLQEKNTLQVTYSESLGLAVEENNVEEAFRVFRHYVAKGAFGFIERAIKLRNGAILQGLTENFCKSTIKEGREFIKLRGKAMLQ